MPMVRAMRLLNAIEAGTTTGGQLQTLLTADPGRLAEFNVLLGMRGQARRLAASSTAMNAVIASSTAMNAVAASSTAMNAVAASSTAMNAVAASSTAMNAVAASSTAKMAIFNSDTALTAVQSSSTALTALRAAAQYSVQSAIVLASATTIPGLNAAGSYVLLGLSSSNAGGTGQQITAINTRRSGSTRPNTNLGVVASNASTATTVSHATPLVTPFTAVDSIGNNYTWFFGLLRCDV